MGAAVVALSWRPCDFWQATPVEFWTAMRSYEEMNRLPDDQ